MTKKIEDMTPEERARARERYQIAKERRKKREIDPDYAERAAREAMARINRIGVEHALLLKFASEMRHTASVSARHGKDIPPRVILEAVETMLEGVDGLEGDGT